MLGLWCFGLKERIAEYRCSAMNRSSISESGLCSLHPVPANASGPMIRARKICALLALLVGGIAGSTAQLQPSNPDSALLTILNQLQGTPLALKDAKQRCIETAPSVRSAEAAVAAARGVVRREGGTFDPEVSLLWDYADQKQPSASFFAGASVLHTVEGTGNAGLKWDLPFGTRIEASLNAVRLNTNSSFAFLSPQYTTIGTLTLRQSLLRGI